MSFKLNFISPNFMLEKEAIYLSLNDKNGRIGIQSNHNNYITLMARTLGYFESFESGKTCFALDQGILRIIDNEVFIISRFIVVNHSYHQLSIELDRVTKIEDQTTTLKRKNIQLLQEAFLAKLAEAERMK